MTDARPRDERIEQIRRAAVAVFGDRGFRGTSMAAIAEAVGISRPALYQYFENREDVFRAAMESLLEDSADRALDALDAADDVETALSGWLRRAHLDGYESLAGQRHAEELLEAHHAFSRDIAARASARMRAGLDDHLSALPGVAPTDVEAAVELAMLAPSGLKSDSPTPAVFGERLDRLAAAIAASLRTA